MHRARSSYSVTQTRPSPPKGATTRIHTVCSQEVGSADKTVFGSDKARGLIEQRQMKDWIAKNRPNDDKGKSFSPTPLNLVRFFRIELVRVLWSQEGNGQRELQISTLLLAKESGGFENVLQGLLVRPLSLVNQYSRGKFPASFN